MLMDKAWKWLESHRVGNRTLQTEVPGQEGAQWLLPRAGVSVRRSIDVTAAEQVPHRKGRGHATTACEADGRRALDPRR